MSIPTENYASPICRYCQATDYGTASVGTGPWNLCEGAYCEEAFDCYNNNQTNEEDKFSTIEQAF